MNLSSLENVVDGELRRWLPILEEACEDPLDLYTFIEEIIPAALHRGLLNFRVIEEGGVFIPIFWSLRDCIHKWLLSEEATQPEYREITERLIRLWKDLVEIAHVLGLQHSFERPPYAELPSHCLACRIEGSVPSAIEERFPNQGLW